MSKMQRKPPRKRRHPFLVYEIPPELRKKFHMLCIKRGTTMQRTVRDLIEFYIASDK